jgi:hypothetical protein
MSSTLIRHPEISGSIFVSAVAELSFDKLVD